MNVYSIQKCINLLGPSILNQKCTRILVQLGSLVCNQQVRNTNIYKIDRPDPRAKHWGLRWKIHYPEDGKYTTDLLRVSKLAGRSLETGRIIIGSLGGGRKTKYRWVDWQRKGPTDGSFLEEKIISIQEDPHRSSFVALVGNGNNLRWLLATENMKEGDIIRTSSFIPRIPVRPFEGDAYPIGALPVGTHVHCVEKMPGDGAKLIKAAGTSGVIQKKLGEKVVIKLPSKREVAVEPTCMATVGRLSNVDHHKEHIGSAQKNRWLGRRPRSGLWHRKDGYCGRKIRSLPPIQHFAPKPSGLPRIALSLPEEEKFVVPSTWRKLRRRV